MEYLANKYPNGQAFTGLVMLVDKNWWILTPKGMDMLAALSKKTNTPIYISPWKDVFTDGEPLYIVQETGDDIYSGKGNFQYAGFNPKDVIPPAELIGAAHARGLRMTSYTSYASYQGLGFYCQESVPKDYDVKKLPYKTVPCPKTKRAEFFYFFDLGMDQMFVENVQEAQQLREEYNMYLISQCSKDDPANLWLHMRDAMAKEGVPNIQIYV